jgi:hypothetical protein
MLVRREPQTVVLPGLTWFVSLPLRFRSVGRHSVETMPPKPRQGLTLLVEREAGAAVLLPAGFG